MTEKIKTEFVCVRESLARTITNDLTDAATLLAMIGVGVWLDSSALQWIAGLLFMLIVVERSLRQQRRRTAQETADWLAKEFDVRAKP